MNPWWKERGSKICATSNPLFKLEWIKLQNGNFAYSRNHVSEISSTTLNTMLLYIMKSMSFMNQYHPYAQCYTGINN